MNITPFPDPAIQDDPIPGAPVPISLISAPYGVELANVATGGLFSFNKDMNPLDLFQTFNPSKAKGVAVLIMNSLTTPLTLVDSFEDVANNGPQLSYPAVLPINTNTAIKPHQIPGARTYPIAGLHTSPDKSPALIFGIGLYRFQACDGSVAIARRALAFTVAEYAGIPGGLCMGVAFDYRSDRPGINGTGLQTAVSADVRAEGSADRQTNLSTLLDDAATGAASPYDVNTTMTIWGVVPHGNKPAYEPDMVTLLVWIRDISSTFGMTIQAAPASGGGDDPGDDDWPNPLGG